jgi:uncharacterized membrane protein YdjX (TVP38/TMEM64 family)
MLRRSFRLLLLLVLTGAAAWLFLSGAYRNLHPEHVRHQLLGLGALGPVVFVLAFTLIQPLGPTGHLFVLAASLVWSAPLAFTLSIAGGVLGHSLYFVIYRYVLHDWAQARIPARMQQLESRLATMPFRKHLARIPAFTRRIESALTTRPFRTVLVLRLLSFTWPMMPALLAASRVRFLPMVAATLLGIAPMTALDVWIGERISNALFAD